MHASRQGDRPGGRGIARRLAGAEAAQVLAALTNNLEGQVWKLIYWLLRYDPVLYEVAPVAENQVAGTPAV